MGKTKHDLLLHVLEELLEEEIKKFKFKLNYMDLREGYKNIPKGHLEKADVVQLVILLIEYYQEEYAVEVAINVLDDINNKMLADWLRKASAEDILQEPRHKAVWNTRVMSAKVPNVDHRGNYIASIKEQFRKLKDYNSKPGEWVSLEDRYTKLFIVKKYHQTQDKEHELLSRGKRHTEIMKKPRNDEDSHITVEHLFDTLADGTSTKKVILQGVAGIGKTSTVCKIILCLHLSSIEDLVQKDEEFVRNALEDVKEMVFLGNNLGQDDQQVILYSLQHAKELHRLTLVQCELKEKYVIKLLPLLGKCKQIYLSASGLSLSTVNTVCAHVLQSLRMTRLHLVYEEDDRMNCTVEASRERDPCIITFDYLPEETVTAICDQIIPAHPGIVRLDVNGIQGRQGFLTALKYSLLESECKLETLGFNIENPKHEAFRNICEHLATHHSPGKFALFRRGSEDDIHFGYEAKDEEKSDDRLQKKKKSKGRKGRSGTQPQCFPLTWFLKKKKNREDGIAILSCLPKEYIVDTVLWVTSKFTPVTLVMDDNSIDDELMETICEKLNNAEYKLQLLSLNSNILAQESMTSICSLFHCNTAVSLSLRYNPLGDEGVKILAACLKSKGCTLKNLSLSSTDLTEDCVPAIASLFSKKNTLIQLDLSFNNLSNSGVKTLCSALKNKESHLEELNLEYNGITDDCEREFIQLIKNIPSLKYLCLDNNEFTSTSASRIFGAWDKYHDNEEEVQDEE
ncbi:NACHT, LRR and PYD domains-containing protein 3-like [Alligator mississippiensis]|uniref:NACHT, LRR and PYD domains-containing protein 3 n=1 Tax=Alligator mississippiensis TaxID=8496 RepID=A0A151P357_ALLMI|nr:NACHT, LRR and PYD domains-containing protein 3-like [Alligator mississippiensis]